MPGINYVRKYSCLTTAINGIKNKNLIFIAIKFKMVKWRAIVENDFFNEERHCNFSFYRIVIFWMSRLLKMLVVGGECGDGDPLGEIGE